MNSAYVKRESDARAGTLMASRSVRRLAWPAVVCVLVMVGMGVCCGVAAGFSQRGHVFAFSFGGAGEDAGLFRFGTGSRQGVPAGIAVDEATGDVYVVDPGNYRVQEFDAGGHFLRAWGWGVADGNAQFEVCETECRAGLPGTGKGQFKEPALIAVDNSAGGSGTVLVDANAGARKPDVQRFAAGGETPLGRLGVEEEGLLDGLAVNASGTVWLYRGEEEETAAIEGFRGSPLQRVEPAVGSPFECPKPGFGVNGSGEVFFVAHELVDGAGECPAVVERERREAKEPAEGALLRPTVVGEQKGEEDVLAQLSRQDTSAVAVNEASREGAPLGKAADGDVYIDKSSSISVFDAAGALVQTFGQGALTQGAGVAIDSKTGDVYVVDAGEEKVTSSSPKANARRPSLVCRRSIAPPAKRDWKDR